LDQLVTINIFGQPFSFASETDTEQAQAVAGQLESEIARIEEQQSGVKSEKAKIVILISAALNIANENFELKSNYTELLQNVDVQSKRLLQLLEVEKIEGAPAVTG
jgi:cell division protein ZapA (FtsZ GTPase activity inhibitor)